MKKLFLITGIAFLLLATTVIAKETQSAGKPFQELWDVINELKEQVESLFTQTDSGETILELQMTEGSTAPPFVISDDDENLVFTVSPDGSIQIGAESVIINPDGTAPGLIVDGDNILDGTITAVDIQEGEIIGEKGDKGDTGDQGIQGIQGLTGDTGDIGLTGDKGDTGDTGTSSWTDGDGKVTTTFNVGIGTTSPGTKLDVAGIINAQDYYHINNKVLAYNVDNAIRYGWDALIEYQIFATSGLERVRIDNTGNVGIGTTTPSAKLDIYGGDMRVANEYGSVTIGIPNAQFSSFSTDRPSFYFNREVVVSDKISSYNQNLVIRADYDNPITGNQLYLKTDGKVGIGTEPSYPLDVYGNIGDWASKFSSASGASVYLAHSDGFGAYINTGTSPSSNTYALSVKGVGDSYLFVRGDGNVGIGTESPSNKLEVSGNVELTNLYDNDASNFFDGACADNQHVTGISSTGAVSCGADSGDISGVIAGTGFSGGGTSGAVTVNADTTYLQRRVSGTCLPGESIRVINQDGTVTCETFVPQTEYLTIAGSQCTGRNLENILADRPFYCQLSTTTSDTDAYWSVNLPNGATVTGFQVHAWPGSGTMTCKLSRGTFNQGNEMATVTRSGTSWAWTAEDTTISLNPVNTAAYAYSVHCTTDTATTSVIGAIRIRYTMAGPN